MNCLVCGHKLAIFRKLSLGDFCCQEHRDLYFKDHQGLARLEARTESRQPAGATRVYAQFLQDEPEARSSQTVCRGYGPLSAVQVMAPGFSYCRFFSRLAPARAMQVAEPQPGCAIPLFHDLLGLRMRLPRPLTLIHDAAMKLHPAGLILPWSGKAGSHTTVSLAPLVAAAWAQSGYSKPIARQELLAGALQFAWPKIEARLETSTPAAIGVAAFAAVESPAMRPMRVRLNMPSAAQHTPELAMPAFVPGDIVSEPTHSFVDSATPVPVSKPSLFTTLLAPPARQAKPRLIPRERDDVFDYNEPAPMIKSATPPAWMAMLSGLKPSAGLASSAFAVLFLCSVLAIFLSAPSALSQRSPSWRWSYLRAAIRDRAVMRVEDDFRSGLNHWIFPTGLSKDWSYDQAGFLRPGKLGFLQDSMNLVDYRLELMGQIERKSLGWAFRARDERNYYVAKLTVARPGPLPMVDLVRYAVTDGKEGRKVNVRLPFSVRNDTLYQVEMNVKGSQFRASVNGHVVDSWSDKRLMAGGVGFVTGQGESSRVRWIRVSDKDDVLGRICSYLSARADRPSSDSSLSASYYTFLRSPADPAIF